MVSKVDFPRASFAHLKAAYHNLGLLKILYRMLKASAAYFVCSAHEAEQVFVPLDFIFFLILVSLFPNKAMSLSSIW